VSEPQSPRRLIRLATAAAERYPRLGRRVITPALALEEQTTADALGIQAGSLTYGAFLSIPPALLIVGSVLGFVLADNTEAQARVVDQIANAIPGLEPFVSDFLKAAIDGRATVGLVGLVALTWTASGFAARARFALGSIFRTGHPGLITGRFAAIWRGLPVVIGLLASIAAMAIAGSIRSDGGTSMAYRAGIELLILAASSVVFLLTYWVLTPGDGPTLRGHVKGALLFTVGFAIARAVGETYVANVVARSTALYGTIGAVFGLLAFLYATMWLFLLGAELSRFSAERDGTGER
jgi:membrane protein